MLQCSFRLFRFLKVLSEFITQIAILINNKIHIKTSETWRTSLMFRLHYNLIMSQAVDTERNFFC